MAWLFTSSWKQSWSVVLLGTYLQMPDCSHGEADIRIIVDVLDTARNGCKKIIVRTVDTDVLVILIGQFHHIKERHSIIELSIAFSVGKDYTMYSINEICRKFERDACKVLPVFHAFTGCDTTSSFHGKGKRVHGKLGNHFQKSPRCSCTSLIINSLPPIQTLWVSIN